MQTLRYFHTTSGGRPKREIERVVEAAAVLRLERERGQARERVRHGDALADRRLHLAIERHEVDDRPVHVAEVRAHRAETGAWALHRPRVVEEHDHVRTTRHIGEARRDREPSANEILPLGDGHRSERAVDARRVARAELERERAIGGDRSGRRRHAVHAELVFAVHRRDANRRPEVLGAERGDVDAIRPVSILERHLQRVLDGLRRLAWHGEHLEREEPLMTPREERGVLRVVAADAGELLVLLRRGLGLHELALEPDRAALRVDGGGSEARGDRAVGDVEEEGRLVALRSAVRDGALHDEGREPAIDLHVDDVRSLDDLVACRVQRVGAAVRRSDADESERETEGREPRDERRGRAHRSKGQRAPRVGSRARVRRSRSRGAIKLQRAVERVVLVATVRERRAALRLGATLGAARRRRAILALLLFLRDARAIGLGELRLLLLGEHARRPARVRILGGRRRRGRGGLRGRAERALRIEVAGLHRLRRGDAETSDEENRDADPDEDGRLLRALLLEGVGVGRVEIEIVHRRERLERHGARAHAHRERGDARNDVGLRRGDVAEACGFAELRPRGCTGRKDRCALRDRSRLELLVELVEGHRANRAGRHLNAPELVLVGVEVAHDLGR